MSLKSLRILCFTILLLSIGSCNKDEIFYTDTTSETNSEERPQGFISFETFSNNIGESRAFMDNLPHIDRNRIEVQAKGGSGFVDAYIDTNTIHLIETDGMNYYTLKIINNNPNEKANTFYNLSFEQDLITGEVTSSILQYNPKLNWLFDKSKPFKGEIKLFDNELITLADLTNGVHLENGGRGSSCTSISASWVCNGMGHTVPGPYGDGSHSCTGSWVIRVSIIPCPLDGGGTGTFDPGDDDDPSGGGGGGGSGPTQTVVLEICDGFTYDGDPGNSEDCEDDYAAYFIPFICEDYEDIGFINDWVISNMDIATDLANYLESNFPEDDENNCANFNDFLDRINGEMPPSCEAFKFNDIIPGVPGWQASGVKNITANFVYINIQTGNVDVANVFFPQPIYFEMPRLSETNGGFISKGRAAELSAEALFTAIQRTKLFFQITEATSSQVQSKLWEYLRDEMQNGVVIGGKAGFVPSQGFNGSITDYKSYWFLPDNCD